MAAAPPKHPHPPPSPPTHRRRYERPATSAGCLLQALGSGKVDDITAVVLVVPHWAPRSLCRPSACAGAAEAAGAPGGAVGAEGEAGAEDEAAPGPPKPPIWRQPGVITWDCLCRVGAARAAGAGPGASACDDGGGRGGSDGGDGGGCAGGGEAEAAAGEEDGSDKDAWRPQPAEPVCGWDCGWGEASGAQWGAVPCASDEGGGGWRPAKQQGVRWAAGSGEEGAWQPSDGDGGSEPCYAAAGEACCGRAEADAGPGATGVARDSQLVDDGGVDPEGAWGEQSEGCCGGCGPRAAGWDDGWSVDGDGRDQEGCGGGCDACCAAWREGGTDEGGDGGEVARLRALVAALRCELAAARGRDGGRA
jgi:hypothetical protein